MKAKQIIGTMLASLMVLSTAACSQPQPPAAPAAPVATEAPKAPEATKTTGPTKAPEVTTAPEPAKAAPVEISITWRDDGQGENNAIARWMKSAYESYPKKDQIKMKLAYITASEGDYFSKIALALKDEKTAPDIVTEDTFQVNADASAGFLEPLDARLATYADWTNGSYIESLKQGVTAQDGKIYGLPYNTDTRGLWYNKEIFKKAGLPEVWEPKTWDEVLDACRQIQKNVPDVVPIWFNSAKATGEATTMQTYEMLLYGTGERLREGEKWIVKSPGILNALQFIDTVYKEKLGPPLSKVLNGQAANTSAREYLPQGKLAISLDGSWITGNYLPNGASPWPEYKDVLGLAKMPTIKGEDPKTITLAGGWALAIPAKSKNKDAAWEFMQHAMSKPELLKADMDMGSITTRHDVAADPTYVAIPFMKEVTDALVSAGFRPAHEQYPTFSAYIQAMVESVASGTAPQAAMDKFATDVIRSVGEENTISK